MSVKAITPHPKKPMPWLLGKEWSEMWRVRLADTSHSAEKQKWCRDNCAENMWARNFGGEVFYFLHLEDAMAFRFKWEGVK